MTPEERAERVRHNHPAFRVNEVIWDKIEAEIAAAVRDAVLADREKTARLLEVGAELEEREHAKATDASTLLRWYADKIRNSTRLPCSA